MRYRIDRFNMLLALSVTRLIGSMGCAYCFVVVACLSLPQAIEATMRGDMLTGVAWFSQSFCQLVLLPIVLVSERVILAGQESESRRERQEAREEARQHREMIAMLAAALGQEMPADAEIIRMVR